MGQGGSRQSGCSLAAGIAFSRRVFLSFVGFASLFATRVARSAAVEAVERPPDSSLVVVRGWVLRRDDLDQIHNR